MKNFINGKGRHRREESKSGTSCRVAQLKLAIDQGASLCCSSSANQAKPCPFLHRKCTDFQNSMCSPGTLAHKYLENVSLPNHRRAFTVTLLISASLLGRWRKGSVYTALRDKKSPHWMLLFRHSYHQPAQGGIGPLVSTFCLPGPLSCSRKTTLQRFQLHFSRQPLAKMGELSLHSGCFCSLWHLMIHGCAKGIHCFLLRIVLTSADCIAKTTIIASQHPRRTGNQPERA